MSWYIKSLDEFQKQYAKWKKADTEDYLMYDCIFMKFQEKPELWKKGTENCCSVIELREVELFGVMEMFCIFFVEVVVQLYTSKFVDLNSLKMSEFYHM